MDILFLMKKKKKNVVHVRQESLDTSTGFLRQKLHEGIDHKLIGSLLARFQAGALPVGGTQVVQELSLGLAGTGEVLHGLLEEFVRSLYQGHAFGNSAFDRRLGRGLGLVEGVVG